MRVVVFAGPTVSAEEVGRHLDAVCRPPVSQGDVHRASLDAPWAIGIIDGYFERVPAVWHKEILWALSRGIHVFGAASMGALRAAELAAFGMVGTGAIFEAYHSGRLADDEEVAILHGPAEAGYVPLSEALVNVRATLATAVAEGIVAEPTSQVLLRVAKGLFYAERRYPRILADALEAGAPAVEVEALQAWLPAGRVDQKARDAIALLELIRERREQAPRPFVPRFHFEHTDMWEQVGRVDVRTSGEAAPPALWLDELRLQGADRFRAVVARAFARAVALEEARRQGLRPAPEEISAEALRFRKARGLRGETELEGWLAEQALSDGAFGDLIADETRLERLRSLFAPETRAAVREVLRLEGDYGRLLRRSVEKQEQLARHFLELLRLEDTGLTEGELLEWHFRGRLGLPVPDDLDGYAEAVGCPDRRALLRVLIRERAFERLSTDAAPGDRGGSASASSSSGCGDAAGSPPEPSSG